MQDKEINTENEALMDAAAASDNRIYEIGYLLAPSIPEENVAALYGNLKELIASMEGKMIADEMPKMIPLAYTMLKVFKNVRNKFNNAYFAWIKFDMDPNKIAELKKKLDLDPNIVRFLIMKTVKENTIASKRFIHRDMTRRKMPSMKKEEGGIVTEIDKEEIDKEIDALIAV